MAWIERFSGIRSLEEFRRRVPDEETARQLLEALVWPYRRFCPRCRRTDTRAVPGARAGLYECRRCRRQFTATTRTPLHGTKLPIRRWLEAIYLTLMSSKGVSSVVLARQLGIGQSSAWKIAHAIRLLMRPPAEDQLIGTVEVDSLTIGGDPKKRNIRRYGATGRLIYNAPGRGSENPTTLIAVEKGTDKVDEPTRAGRVRAAPLDGLSAKKIEPVLAGLVAKKAALHSDDDQALKNAGAGFASHETVVHSKHEYARGPVHANTAEGFNNTIRRAYIGVWHYWSPQHGQRYIEELAFRAGQRQVVRKKRTIRGKSKTRLVSEPIPVIEQMRVLFADAVGREMRRTKVRGVAEIGRSRPAYSGTNLAPAAPVKAPAAPASPPDLDDHIPF